MASSFRQPRVTQRQRQRMVFVVTVVVGLAAATALVLYSLGQNLLYFYSPTQVLNGQAPADRDFRVGGMVVEGSVLHDEANPLTVYFSLTDYRSQISLAYTGLLPDLFAEGQGTVASGKLRADGVFVARQVLAKHDETYMPAEVVEALEQGAAEPIGVRMSPQ